jgi:hypothetical protein
VAGEVQKAAASAGLGTSTAPTKTALT